MTLKNAAVIALTVIVLTAAWVHVVRYRAVRSRLWSLLARKPYLNRRGYHLRLMIYSVEDIEVLAPALTVTIAAMALGVYVVEIHGGPGFVGIGLILGPGAVAITTYFIKVYQLARRLGLECPGCCRYLTDMRGVHLLKSGLCPLCSTSLFRRPQS